MVLEGGIRGGEIGEEEIGDGGCEGFILCLSLIHETCWFTVPPTVAQ
jgi:hypothetical protein